jgi:hypothetical protein
MRIPAEVLAPGHDYRSVTDKLTALVLTKNTPFAWFVATGIGFVLLSGMMLAISYLLLKAQRMAVTNTEFIVLQKAA